MMKTVFGFFETIYYYFVSSYKMYNAKRAIVDDLIYTTKNGVCFEVFPGKKQQSPHDFIVKFKIPDKRLRTPSHVHLIVEMYVKYAFNQNLTLKLKKHLLNMLENINPVFEFPPKLQYFKPEHIKNFDELNNVGEFSVEFLLVAIELIAIQEKTNYPKGNLTETLYKDFAIKDRFSVIQKSIWRGR